MPNNYPTGDTYRSLDHVSDIPSPDITPRDPNPHGHIDSQPRADFSSNHGVVRDGVIYTSHASLGDGVGDE